MNAHYSCAIGSLAFSCIFLPSQVQCQTAVLRVIEVDHDDRIVDGSLVRDDSGDRVPIKRGLATLREWRAGEMLVVYPDNTERYASPHYEVCPLPASNVIQVRTRAGNRRVIDNAAYLETRDALLGSYANYLLAGRLKTTQDTAAGAAARQKSIELLGKELGVAQPIKAVKGTTVVTTSEFETKLAAYQRQLGVTATGELDYATLKAANKNIPASRFVTESATSADFSRPAK